MAKTEKLSQDIRANIVHLRKPRMSQSIIDKQLGEKRDQLLEQLIEN